MNIEHAVLAGVLTILVYRAALWLRRKVRTPLAHPSVIAAALLFALLPVFRISASEYTAGSRWLTFLAGPATVAMAVPIYKHRRLIRTQWPSLLSGVLASCMAGMVTAIGAAFVLGLGRTLALTAAPKVVTGAVAFWLSKELGGIPALSLAMTQATGITGAIIGPGVLNAFRVRNRLARGLALGAAAHAGGAERAMQIGELEGAVGSMAMALTILIASVLVPLVAPHLVRAFGLIL